MKYFSPEHRARISAAKMGHSPSADTRSKISRSVSIAQQGRPVPVETRRNIALAQSGEKAHHWAGDEVGYSGIHKRARAVLPLECSLADQTCSGRIEAALRREALGPLRQDRRGAYSPRVEDYWPLCKSHHNRYDGIVPPPETRLRRALARS